MKRIVAILLVLVLLLCVCALPISAKAPGPAEGGDPFPVNPVLIALLVVTCAAGVVLTVVVEWLIGKVFGIGRHHKKLVVWTNIATQIILRILQFFTFSLLPNGMSAVVWCSIYLPTLEFLVYLAEFLVYNRRMRDVSWKKCLLYTVTANTASLLVGLLLLFVLL